METIAGKISLVIVIICAPLSIVLLVLMIGFAGSPWTNVFQLPSELDGIILFFIFWTIIVSPWVILSVWFRKIARQKKSRID
ncbi:MAG: hypothetical protein ABJP02_16775 [Parasphingorhabdus sp.]|uniref:hypothetical protein n=1 Tax=Parasphingorhabdus sp. TaxID=2709688 RepID=UPI003297A802